MYSMCVKKASFSFSLHSTWKSVCFIIIIYIAVRRLEQVSGYIRVASLNWLRYRRTPPMQAIWKKLVLSWRYELTRNVNTFDGPPTPLKRALAAATTTSGLCSYISIVLNGPHRLSPNNQMRFIKLLTTACRTSLNICDLCKPLHEGLCISIKPTADLKIKIQNFFHEIIIKMLHLCR